MIINIVTAIQSATATENKSSYEWGNVPLGANGFITGMVIHPKEPNLIYCRTDVGGCYRFDIETNVWTPLNDSFGLEWQSLYSIDGIALDSNNPDVVYIAAGGAASWEISDILKSEDRGNTWKRLNFKGGVFDGNGGCRGWGECIAVDPTDSNIIYCGTYNTGLWRSRDGGIGWEQVFDVSNLSEAVKIRSITFDNDKGRSRIYASGSGAYLWYSDDNGTTWTQDTNAPKNIKRMAVDSKGILYLAGTDGLFKYDNGTVTNISPDTSEGTYNAVSVSLADDNYIVCVGPHTKANEMNIPFWVSKDGGATWTKKSDTRRVTSTLRWDSATDSTTKNIASNAHCMLIDPIYPERVWISDWFCVSMTKNIDEEPYQKWDYLYKGIEEVCPRDFICPPSGDYRLIAAIADIDGVVYSNYKEYPERRIRENRKAPFMMGTSAIDYCKEKPEIVVRVGIDYNTKYKAEISYDNTKTWNDISFRKADNLNQYWDLWQFGQVAVSAQVNPKTGYPSIVVIPSGRIPLVSLDGGLSWSQAKGITDTIISSQYWDKGIYLSSDGADGSTFYIQDRNAMTGTNSSIYVSRDWGVTWEKTTTLSGAWYPDKTFIKCAPGLAGDVWSCAGGRYMYHSTDYGKTWISVAGISNVQCFGFGKNAPSSKYPAIYAYATVNGVTGVFRSVDAGKSWMRINDDNNKIGKGPYVIEGDMQTFGVVYIGTGGRGIFYGKPAETEYHEDFSNTASNSDWVKYYHSQENGSAQLVSSNGYSVKNGVLRNEWDAAFMGKRYCLYNGNEWADDIKFGVSIKNDGNSAGNRALVLFGYRDAENYYYVTVDGTNGVTLGKYVKGTDNIIKSVKADNMAVKYGVSLVISHTGSTIKVLSAANGKETLLMRAKDESFGGGFVGVGSLYSVCEFDNVYVVNQVEEIAEPVIDDASYTVSDDKININAHAYSCDKDGKIFAASYDADGGLISISKISIVRANSEFEYNAQIAAQDKIKTIKVFMWDANGTMTALCPCMDAVKN